jgi:glutamate-5-semialdehyde dehydrogenase
VSTTVESIRGEAEATRDAVRFLTDERVEFALAGAAEALRARSVDVLDANSADYAAAEDRLDSGSLDRLRLTPERLDDLARQLLVVSDLPPLDRSIESRTLANGLRVTARKIPIGVVGVNFEARPGVALDVASQLLKSLNGCVLRTGSAALRTVTVLVDTVLRPALEVAGIPGAAVGLMRAEGHEGAEALVSMPDLVPLVILRGSGESTAELARRAAANGVHVLAHAEGGGVLYVDSSADAVKADALIGASLDRLGVCNRLNLLLVHEDFRHRLAEFVALLEGLGITAHGTARVRELVDVADLDVPVGHEWATDPDRVASVTIDLVDSVEAACELANRSTSGLAAGIVAEDDEAVAAFFDGYRGTAVFLHAPTRFADGYALLGAPETGINIGFTPGPRGPVTYHDLWLRQLQVVGDGTQTR